MSDAGRFPLHARMSEVLHEYDTLAAQIRAAAPEGGPTGDQARALDMCQPVRDTIAAAAASLLTDPTLATEPSWGTGRFRIVDLVLELARQIRGRLRWTIRPDREITADQWEETTLMYERALLLGACIPDVVPRTGTGTPEVSRRISEERMATQHDDLARAADVLREIAGLGQYGLAHPAPRAYALTQLANLVEVHAGELSAVHDQTIRAADAALHPSAPPTTRSAETGNTTEKHTTERNRIMSQPQPGTVSVTDLKDYTPIADTVKKNVDEQLAKLEQAGK